MKTKLFTLGALILFFVSACGSGGDEQPDPCSNPINISVTTQQNSNAGQSSGSFTVAATGVNGGFEYSVDNNPFQSSATFSGLAAGTYTLTAKDNQECTATIQVIVGENPQGSVPSFANVVLPIMQNFCATSGCHVTGGNAPFVINGFSDVQSRAASIKSRVAAQTMPPSASPSLSSSQIASIVAWVDGGAPDN